MTWWQLLVLFVTHHCAADGTSTLTITPVPSGVIDLSDMLYLTATSSLLVTFFLLHHCTVTVLSGDRGRRAQRHF